MVVVARLEPVPSEMGDTVLIDTVASCERYKVSTVIKICLILIGREIVLGACEAWINQENEKGLEARCLKSFLFVVELDGIEPTTS